MPHHPCGPRRDDTEFRRRARADKPARGTCAWSWLTLLALLSACGAPTPELVLAPDASRADEAGQLGPYGVAVTTRPLRVRVDEVIDITLSYPAQADGEAVEGAFPLIVFVHGGLVGPEHYQWLMTHLASRGAIVAAPAHALDLAILAQGNALDALDALRRASARPEDALAGRIDPAPALILGHSLGGVVAASSWEDAPAQLRCLGLLASEPNPADDFAGYRPPSPQAHVLSITGARDGKIDPDEVRAGALRLAPAQTPVTLAIVDGMNHYQWTQDYTADELTSDLSATREDEDARALAMTMIDRWVSACLGGDSAPLIDPQRWPQGVLSHEAWRAMSDEEAR